MKSPRVWQGAFFLPDSWFTRPMVRCARRAVALLVMAVLMTFLSFAAARETGERAVQPRGPLDVQEQRDVGLFRQAFPSVVHINTLEIGRQPFSTDTVETPLGSGTGFVWDENGHVVTNFHVIANGNAASVTLADQSVWPAELVGYFADRDLAVLRIRPDKGIRLRPIPLGTSGDLLVGQHVFAIGNPFGLDLTMTRGIVSALGREVPISPTRRLRGAIQTDAAINPGNSGGPLLDSAGRLVGVNTAIYSPSGSSVGIGFAIPVDEVARIIPRLIRDGRFVRPSLGIAAAPASFLEALSLPPGVALARVDADGPAARAGLEAFTRRRDGRINPGDTIVALDDRPVNSLDDLHAALEAFRAGDTVRLTVRRLRQTRQINVTLAPGD